MNARQRQHTLASWPLVRRDGKAEQLEATAGGSSYRVEARRQLHLGNRQLLRGPYKPNEYGNVVLPMTTLRRLDCVLASTKQAVHKEWIASFYKTSKDILDVKLRKRSGYSFARDLLVPPKYEQELSRINH